MKEYKMKLSRKQNIPPRLAVETDEVFPEQPLTGNNFIEDDK